MSFKASFQGKIGINEQNKRKDEKQEVGRQKT